MMKVYGSPLCPDCVAFKKNLDTDQIPYEFIDITAAIPKLREFLNLRDHDSAFDDVKKNGSVGIPAIVRDDGTVTTDWEAVIKDAGYTLVSAESTGSACSLEHPGNC